jgi:hypothetical protein
MRVGWWMGVGVEVWRGGGAEGAKGPGHAMLAGYQCRLSVQQLYPTQPVTQTDIGQGHRLFQ